MGRIIRNDIEYGGGGADYVELTQAQYDALPSTQKMDGTMYLITDGGGEGSTTMTFYDTTEPSSDIGKDGDIYVLYDDTNDTITTIYIKIEGDWLPIPSGGSGGGSSITVTGTVTT